MEQAHIYIFGEIDCYQDTDSQIRGFVNLTSVKNQLEQTPKAKEIIVHIHSNGGSIHEGFAIYDFLKAQKKPITTIVEGNCYSIATVIALAGDTRKMTSNSDFLIHNSSVWLDYGSKEDLRESADDLEAFENKIADLYAMKTNLTEDEALAFMEKETVFDSEEALKHGFVNEVINTMAVARVGKSRINNKNMKNKEFEKQVGVLEGLINKVKSMVNPKQKAVVVQDANGTELDFSEVEEGIDPAVGDSATVDGKPASGEYVMPNGSTYVFEDGTLTEIKEKEEKEDNEDNEEIENLKKENKALKSEIDELKSKMNKNMNSMKGIVNELNELKKNLKSNYNYSPNIEREEPKVTGRRLFKN